MGLWALPSCGSLTSWVLMAAVTLSLQGSETLSLLLYLPIKRFKFMPPPQSCLRVPSCLSALSEQETQEMCALSANRQKHRNASEPSFATSLRVLTRLKLALETL